MKTLFTLTFILITLLSYSQTILAPFFEKDKWGYMTPQGEIIIEAQYQKAFPFSEDGLAVVLTTKDKWQYINTKNEAITVTYEKFIADKKGFKDGLAVVIFNKKKGVINTKGEEVIAPKYDFILPFENGYTIAKIKKDFIILSKDGTEKKVDYIANRFQEGMSPIRNKEKKFGFINTNGEVVIEPKFLSVGYFNNGIAWAKNEDKKVGFINTKGEWVIEPVYLAAKNMDSQTGFARVRDENGWFFISTSGKKLTVEGVIAFGDFHEGLAWARYKDKKIGFINAKGEWVIEPKYTVARNFSAGYCAVKFEEKWGFINMNGDWSIKPTLIKVKNFKLVQ